jgi:integrase
VHVSPHDFRRYSASYASRNGIPLEIVSKVILRHRDLKTPQVYLGKISDSEAIRWMDILHGKYNRQALPLETMRSLGEITCTPIAFYDPSGM